jgi:hypothetical protein
MSARMNPTTLTAISNQPMPISFSPMYRRYRLVTHADRRTPLLNVRVVRRHKAKFDRDQSGERTEHTRASANVPSTDRPFSRAVDMANVHLSASNTPGNPAGGGTGPRNAAAFVARFRRVPGDAELTHRRVRQPSVGTVRRNVTWQDPASNQRR